MTELPDKTVAETKTLTLNFAPDLTTGVSLSGPTFTKSHFRTDDGCVSDDAAGTALVIGASQVIDQKVLVLIDAGLDGNHYRVVGHVIASDGQKLDNAVQFAVRDSAA